MPFPAATKTAYRAAMGWREWLAWLLLALVLSLGASQIVRAQRGDANDISPRYQPDDSQPFERAGDNFPGSAFYYLDDTGSLIVPDHAVLSSDTGSGLGIGESARGLIMRGSPVDHARALQCLTAAIYYEAAMEADAGQQAVAQVILNRMMHPSYPDTVCGVVYQGSERVTGCQFTFSCDGALARAPSAIYWQRARNVAQRALSGYVYRPVGTATHYHTTEVSPYWAPSLDFIGTIGAHRFYRWKGAAGRSAAFMRAYLGGEPFPGPKPHAAFVQSGTIDPLDPLVLARAYEAARLKAEAENAVSLEAQRMGRPAGSPTAASVAGVAPAYAPDVVKRGGDAVFRGSNLPDNGQIRPEYRNSGQWIRQPGT